MGRVHVATKLFIYLSLAWAEVVQNFANYCITRRPQGTTSVISISGLILVQIKFTSSFVLHSLLRNPLYYYDGTSVRHLVQEMHVPMSILTRQIDIRRTSSDDVPCTAKECSLFTLCIESGPGKMHPCKTHTTCILGYFQMWPPTQACFLNGLLFGRIIPHYKTVNADPHIYVKNKRKCRTLSLVI